MRMTRSRLLTVVLVATLTGCQPPADQSATAAEAVRAADLAWAQTFVNKDLAAGAAFMESTGVVLPPNAPIVTGGPAGYRGLVESFFALPGFAGGWQPTTVVAARSGDLAYSIGTYELSWNDPTGKRVTDRGKYATIWRKQADGNWKVALDMFNADAPASQ